MPSLSSPVHRVVVNYDTQFHDKKYISPTPLIPFASHLIVDEFDLTIDNKKKTIVLNGRLLDDSSLIKMWIDFARMQGSGINVMLMLSPESIKKLSENFTGYYKPLSSCITDRRLDGIQLVLFKSHDYNNVVKLIQQLKADFGEKFIVTLTPVPSELQAKSDNFGFDYRSLERDHGAKIDWYNVQFYGTLQNTAVYESVVTGFPLDPSRIVACMQTLSGATFVQLNTVKSTMRKLLEKYGNRFGGVLASEYYESDPDPDEPWTWAVVMKQVMGNYKEVLALEHINAT